MKAYGRLEIQLHPFLITVLDGDKWSASHPEPFIFAKEAAGALHDRSQRVTIPDAVEIQF
jgi:hypothetical protein